MKPHTRKINDTHLEQLSERKHKLRKDIESSTDIQKRKNKQTELREVKKETKKRLKEVETQQIDGKMAKIETMKNDSTRYFAALKELQSCKKKENLVVKDKEGKIAATDEEQIKIISDYFQKMLAPDNKKENIIECQPHTMRNPFTAVEIEKAAKKLKNGKSPGPDSIELELIKYAPVELHGHR